MKKVTALQIKGIKVNLLGEISIGQKDTFN